MLKVLVIEIFRGYPLRESNTSSSFLELKHCKDEKFFLGYVKIQTVTMLAHTKYKNYQ